MTEQTTNLVRETKKLALVGMALGVIGIAMGIGGLVLRSGVPEVREFRKMYKGKEAVVRVIGKQTQVNWGNYVGIDYWHVNGRGTWEEIAKQQEDGSYKHMKNMWEREIDPKCREIESKLDNIIEEFYKSKRE